MWAPQGGEDAAAIDVTFPHRGALTYLGFVVSRGGGPDAHVLRQAGIARRVIEKMELEYGGRAAVTFNQALLMWTIHGPSPVRADAGRAIRVRRPPFAPVQDVPVERNNC